MNWTHYTPGIHLRQDDDGQHRVEGYVVRYGDRATLFDEYTEQISRGAFEMGKRVPLNVMHESSKIIGSYPGTVELEDRAEGLAIRARMPETQEARDAITLLREGVLNGFSSEFWPEEQDRTGNHIIVKRAKLLGVGLVNDPAYPRSTATLRSRSTAELKSSVLAIPDRSRLDLLRFLV